MYLVSLQVINNFATFYIFIIIYFTLLLSKYQSSYLLSFVYESSLFTTDLTR